ncbi:MAG TPA: DoxX family protein [Dongiaceae bacterium]|jgi:putative oxidoreductase
MTSTSAVRSNGLAGLCRSIITLLERIPVALPEFILRLGVSLVFFRSFLAKIASWDTTVLLFANEYNVPLLPPDFAAVMATGVELLAPIMLVLGLGTRLAAAAMLGMTAVIQVFVYPGSYPDHLLWAGPLLYLLLRGPGAWSIDARIRGA